MYWTYESHHDFQRTVSAAERIPHDCLYHHCLSSNSLRVIFSVSAMHCIPCINDALSLQLNGSPMTASVGTGLALPGYTLLLNADLGGAVWSYVASDLGAVPLGANAWERLRVRQGEASYGGRFVRRMLPRIFLCVESRVPTRAAECWRQLSWR